MKPVFPPSGSPDEITSWVNGPHPPEVLRAEDALTTIAPSRTRALAIAYALFDSGLLVSDQSIVLPEPTRWFVNGSGMAVPVWETPRGEVYAWPGEVDTEGLNEMEQQALATLAMVAYTRRPAAQTVGDEG